MLSECEVEQRRRKSHTSITLSSFKFPVAVQVGDMDFFRDP